jgi:hypothetical protein
MFGIILGTLCLIALIRTIGRERYYRRHGYPQYPHGYYGCGYRGGYGHHHHHGWHPGAPPPDAPPAQPPTAPAPEGGGS